MSDQIWTHCPHCAANFKLKDRSAVGTTKRCPKCGEPFTVERVRAPKSADKMSAEKRSARATGERSARVQSLQSPLIGSPRRSSTARGRRKRTQSRGLPLPWMLAGGGILVVGVVVGFVVLRRGASEPEQLASAENSKAMTSEVASNSTPEPAAESDAPAVAKSQSPAPAAIAPLTIAKGGTDASAPAGKETAAAPTPTVTAPAPVGAPADGGGTGIQESGDAVPPPEGEMGASKDASQEADSSEDEGDDGRGRGKDSDEGQPLEEGAVAIIDPKPGKSGAGRPVIQAKPTTIQLDGKFDDWADITSYTDPEGDTHDVDHKKPNSPPKIVEHADTDLLEYKVAHDAENLYLYFRSRGQIGRTQKRGRGKQPGRYYVIVTIDVDQNDETGYWLHEGGYWPTSPGYDVNAEVEYYGGTFNTGHYLNHGCRNEAEKAQAFRAQSSGQYRPKKDGPYKAGFMRVAPGTYKHYTQWVYHDDDTITFVRDKGPVVRGIIRASLSKDAHEIEVLVPYKGFLVDPDGKPIMSTGQTLDISFSLESSYELVADKLWTSDTGEPIEGYVLTADGSSNEPTAASPTDKPK